MAALLVMLAVMTVLMSVAMPVWRHEAQREKEEELVFRGLQYVRAIRLYQAKNQNLPASIDALVQGHYLRKKYKDPITNGDFVPLSAASGAAGQIGQPAPAPGRGGQTGQPQLRGAAGRLGREDSRVHPRTLRPLRSVRRAALGRRVEFLASPARAPRIRFGPIKAGRITTSGNSSSSTRSRAVRVGEASLAGLAVVASRVVRADAETADGAVVVRTLAGALSTQGAGHLRRQLFRPPGGQH